MDDLNVVREIPRRRVSHSVDSAAIGLPRARRIVVIAGIIQPLNRLRLWVRACIIFFFGSAIDVVLRRDSEQRRAVRLRRIFEDTGGSFAKLGQQLSMRADLLPYAYCQELGKILDQARPISTQEAIAIIERNLGRSLRDVFEIFDPEPIGSASLACVYQAKLRTGDRVAVKVRRPGIGPLIAADLRALDWLLIAAETLTFIRPGLTRTFRQDLRTMLLDELNFRAEARYTDLFRRRARKRGNDVTAPRVYFQYCTEEVLVSELVSGVWIWELMAAVDSNDHEFLLKLRGMGIEPKSLASKLMQFMHQELLEELFFHADPHPANIVVLPNNRICLIDFGAIGRFSTQTRKTWRELHHHMINGDIGRMVNCSISLFGPLPPLDVNRLVKEVEQIYADWVYAMRSRDAEWWERSTAQAWLRYVGVARDFGISVSLEMIQLYRAALLYDSMITRLHKDINFADEYAHYAQKAAKAARKRARSAARQRSRGPTDADYLTIEQFADMTTQFLFKLQRAAEDPVVRFRNIVGKISYVVALLLRLGYLTAALIGAAVLADTVALHGFGYEIPWSSIVEAASSFGWIQLTLIAIALVLIRRVVIRLSLPDQRLDSRD
jgi:ubiquinone biosynthesis protein